MIEYEFKKQNFANISTKIQADRLTSLRQFNKRLTVDVDARNPVGLYDFGSPQLFTEGIKSLETAKGPLKVEASITQAFTEFLNFETRISAILCRSDSLSITGFPVPLT